MIILFGLPGAGKSLQGQLLATRMNWRWLSAGQLLRDSRDAALIAHIQTGMLAPNDVVNSVMSQALSRAGDIDKVILDGFPRQLEQAQWLINSQSEHDRAVDLVIVLDVSENEVRNRLALRGRADDSEGIITDRFAIYHEEIDPVLEYFAAQGITIAHVNGEGTVGEVHDRIVEELTARALV